MNPAEGIGLQQIQAGTFPLDTQMAFENADLQEDGAWLDANYDKWHQQMNIHALASLGHSSGHSTGSGCSRIAAGPVRSRLWQRSSVILQWSKWRTSVVIVCRLKTQYCNKVRLMLSMCDARRRMLCARSGTVLCCPFGHCSLCTAAPLSPQIGGKVVCALKAASCLMKRISSCMWYLPRVGD